MNSAQKPGALAGIKVLDFSTLVPGPMATLFLQRAGAEVLKIERPGSGDEMRSYMPQWQGASANFHLLNQGKASLALDLKSPEAIEVLRPLIAAADIVVEQFRPGVMARLGLGYDQMQAINPGLIYCSITGYGQTGPNAARAGHDLNYVAEAGMLALAHGDRRAPVIPPALIADIAGGCYPALVNILMALIARMRTGEGAHLDIAMSEGVLPFLYWAQADGEAGGNWPQNADALVTGGSARYRLYAAKDGGLAAVAPIEQKFWEIFCNLIDLPQELRDDSRDTQATMAAVAARIAAKDSDHWRAAFAQADCCCSMLRELKEVMQDPALKARGSYIDQLEGEDGTQLTALPLPLSPALRATASFGGKGPRLEHPVSETAQ